MRFGVCAGPENSAILEAAGFDYLEIGVVSHLRSEQREEDVMPGLRAALGRSSLKSETFNLLLPGDLKVVGPQIDTARQERYLATVFQRAYSLGGRIAVFGSGGARQLPPGWPGAEAPVQVIEFLRLCGEAAAKYQMQVAIEPLNGSECNLINSVAEACALAQEVGHPAVGVLSDLYHVTHDHQSFEETREAAPWLLHVHVAGKEGRRAPAAADHAFLRSFFAVLKDIDYTGRVSIEGQWDDLPGQAAAARQVIQEAWEQA